jgi:hypothetical protein
MEGIASIGLALSFSGVVRVSQKPVFFINHRDKNLNGIREYQRKQRFQIKYLFLRFLCETSVFSVVKYF